MPASRVLTDKLDELLRLQIGVAQKFGDYAMVIARGLGAPPGLLAEMESHTAAVTSEIDNCRDAVMGAFNELNARLATAELQLNAVGGRA